MQTDLSAANLVLGLTWFVVFLFSTTLHEASHALAAYKLGDPTAYHGGQVSLNPLPHLRREPIGMVAIPLLTYFTQGWMMGWASAPYDPSWARRYPKRAAVMALAGPAANLTLVLAAGLAIRAGMAAGAFHAPDRVGFTEVTSANGHGAAAAFVMPLSLVFSLNLILFIFNLLPLPPLDGSAVLPAFLSAGAAQRYSELLHQPMMSMLGLLVAWKLFGPIYDPLQILALKLLYPGVIYH
ncbi:MAG TPA: site-2 protease family protein [Thermoanaerobaculia bacterium]|nr:site-2 protease family protein [Thermoanaerobaculia bacterium]